MDHLENKDIDLFKSLTDLTIECPVVTGISAGFPSPAADFMDLSIDLNKHLIKHPSATYFGKAKGSSMKDAGIDDGDLLVIDKSLAPGQDRIAICFIDGEFTVKRLNITKQGIWLMPANPSFKPLLCNEDNDLRIWGIVTHVIKSI